MSGTRYAEVAEDLTRQIATGRFPVGSLLPTEFELCARYGVSRHTVRSALDELQGLGLVSRRKKVGTRVEAARPPDRFRQSLASIEDLVQFGATHRRDVREVSNIVADRSLADQLGCEVGRPWLRISSLRWAGEADTAPVGWTDVYIDAAYADLAGAVRASPNVLVSHLIEERHGRRVAEIQQDVQASILPDRIAGALDAEPGATALRIVRRYADDAAEVFEVSVTVHPADRFTLSSRLSRSTF